SVDVSGKDGGGDVIIDAGGSIALSAPIRSEGTSPTGPGGFVDVTSGLASNAGLRVSDDITAPGGPGSGFGQSISLVGCTLTVDPQVHVDGHGGGSTGTRAPAGADNTAPGRRPARLCAPARVATSSC